jgi:hypothetical protein
MIVALLLALSTPAEIAAWDGLPIPDGVGIPAAKYITCISDPVLDGMEAGETPAPSERAAMMDKTLEGCRQVRAEATEAMEAKMAQTPGWTDAAIRSARIERILDAAEERVGFTARNPKGFQAMVEAIRQCRVAGGHDCEDKAAAQMPASPKAN